MSNTIEKALLKQKQKNALANNSNEESASNNVPEPQLEATDAAKPETTSPKSSFKINLQRLSGNGHISLSGERRQINEEYREIKRKLLANAFGPLAKTLHNPNIIMVTSSRPSEGKTFTATNLALSIAAEQDKTVLLVDADVLKPNVLNTLGLERRKGLMEYLVGEVDDISEVLYSTNIDKLKIIPAGRSHHLSTEMLASHKMHETVDEFANRYPDRIVIFDTPPLIGINESAILANFAGQAVVVVEEGKAKLSDVKMSVERLNPDMAIGFVVNKSVHYDTDGSGYYGYYYSERED
ncbi:Exopolysaccharide biosynthesis protein [Alteromonas sp. 38]|jgi:exopolysaccharide/PEP-CTERM locus tyrosine autokinase|uniref:XrtA-associated tyrosine autokinase n=1 Tax=Alteromonas TaxID=226 RepID=UPI0012F2D553|nr:MULTISPECIES: XrtA-associated tyrosine autokinase [Alteromonas]CAD5265251.1 Exopolysaccharide biosynthesis protein [Alteromonas sp. 154]VXC12164.1 Exopolysaccharide biosynthesis protein [Alteromonas sp. 38]|tara:strand:+ start:5329 stop:6216 length:888 start_codon:yes stop_codon:yes gene_type:complete